MVGTPRTPGPSAAPAGQDHLAHARRAEGSGPGGARLSTQQLVELLKLPTYVGEARRVILDHLGRRYRRTFAGPREFVGFAHEQHLELDFTTPPQRPG